MKTRQSDFPEYTPLTHSPFPHSQFPFLVTKFITGLSLISPMPTATSKLYEGILITFMILLLIELRRVKHVTEEKPSLKRTPLQIVFRCQLIDKYVIRMMGAITPQFMIKNYLRTVVYATVKITYCRLKTRSWKR